MEDNLLCPCCDSILTITHKERYQDLLEHVSDPNGEPTLKNGYQCPNKNCVANICDVSWIEDGDYYTNNRPLNISRKDLLLDLEKKYGTACAVNSWNFYYEIGKKAIKKRSWQINLHWYKFNIIPKERGWEYPLEIRYQPHPWKHKIEIWKKSSDFGYTNIIPFWRMTSFSLDQFKKSYYNWKETGNFSDLKRSYCTAHSLDEWNMNPDRRFYSKLTSFIIKFFYPKKVSDLNIEFKNYYNLIG